MVAYPRDFDIGLLRSVLWGPKRWDTQGRPSPKSMMHTAYLTYFQKFIILPPTSSKFKNFSSIFVQFTFFASPYFDQDAFMLHHILHVLQTGAPGDTHSNRKQSGRNNVEE